MQRTVSMLSGKVPLLFTPGPLTTSKTVKEAMLVDLGSRDPRFMRVVKEVRDGLLSLAGVSQQAGYECVPLQGSGTFGVEAVLSSSVPRPRGKVVVAINGAYGERMLSMVQRMGAAAVPVRFSEREAITIDAVMEQVDKHEDVTHVAVVHHETTAGVLNDVHGLGVALRRHSSGRTAAEPAWHGGQQTGPVYVVDSMSAFGAYPVNMAESNISFLVSSSNKCIEGVPGFSYALCHRPALEACKGRASTISLDLHAQWAGLEASGQFRFTPPTHAMLAFHQALAEHKAEGGWAGRLARYQSNFATLVTEMAALGFKPYVPPAHQGCIITTFLVPDDPAFHFQRCYEALAGRGFVLYPGKTTQADSFRIGSIGQLREGDMRDVVAALKEVLVDMGVKLPVKQKA